VKNISPKVFLVAFRAEYKVSKKKLIDSAYKRLLAAEADLIVVNDVGKKGAGFVSDTNEVYIVDRNRKAIHVPLAPKHEVARKIWDVIKHKLKPK
jgi:phosphopantothenoylcysteine decarboxylase/phosphopantothenate--cysteine ligase